MGLKHPSFIQFFPPDYINEGFKFKLFVFMIYYNSKIMIYTINTGTQCWNSKI